MFVDCNLHNQKHKFLCDIYSYVFLLPVFRAFNNDYLVHNRSYVLLTNSILDMIFSILYLCIEQENVSKLVN